MSLREPDARTHRSWPKFAMPSRCGWLRTARACLSPSGDRTEPDRAMVRPGRRRPSSQCVSQGCGILQPTLVITYQKRSAHVAASWVPRLKRRPTTRGSSAVELGAPRCGEVGAWLRVAGSAAPREWVVPVYKQDGREDRIKRDSAICWRNCRIIL